ncbi:MAG: AAC(3) family N-acetyltransferase [Pseudomonadota bacterium]
MTLTAATITAKLTDLGVGQGDRLLVHSAYSTLEEVDGGVETVVAALLAAVGKSGTVVFYPEF